MPHPPEDLIGSATACTDHDRASKAVEIRQAAWSSFGVCMDGSMVPNTVAQAAPLPTALLCSSVHLATFADMPVQWRISWCMVSKHCDFHAYPARGDELKLHTAKQTTVEPRMRRTTARSLCRQ